MGFNSGFKGLNVLELDTPMSWKQSAYLTKSVQSLR